MVIIRRPKVREIMVYSNKEKMNVVTFTTAGVSVVQ